MAPNLADLTATLAGRYRIERELGRGAWAALYLATSAKHDRHVAIKVLHPELAASLGAERFLREIHIAAGLTHPHILPLIDSGEAGGLLYYVTPHVADGSLRERLLRERRGAGGGADPPPPRRGAPPPFPPPLKSPPPPPRPPRHPPPRHPTRPSP